MEQNAFAEGIGARLPDIASALPVAVAVALGAAVVNYAIGRALKIAAARTNLTEGDLAPVRGVARWIVRIVAAIAIAGVLGFELGGIWAMVSTVLAMVAIGFVAVWSLLSNMSSTMLILFLRPFQVGDDIELAGEQIKGRVVDLNFFYTTLLDSDGRSVQVPNSLFFQKAIKRRHGKRTVSLAHQLNSPDPAALDAPPKEAGDGKPSGAKRSEPDPLMSIPDPATIMPRQDGK